MRFRIQLDIELGLGLGSGSARPDPREDRSTQQYYDEEGEYEEEDQGQDDYPARDPYSTTNCRTELADSLPLPGFGFSPDWDPK